MIKDDLYKLNLQFFAENEGDSENTNEDDNKESENDNDSKQETYTKNEVDSAISKAVDSALKKRERKHQQDLENAREEARKKAESYAKLTEKEKRDKEIEEREQALAEKEKEFKLRELKSDVESDLKEKGLPTSFAESLIHLEDVEKINEVVKEIKADFDNAVQEQVKEVTRQSTPNNQSSNFANRQASSKSFEQLAKENRIIK
ncbi:capsid assembly scaffolding protein Gp46 family protein [Staphylococcus haemolyticus]|uniref:capsid assembly scaffolding protein Gp46 family protein n=1 Tax=Staphylococcus haemolyticus TaxID=1283 RepID=UPI0030BAE9F7